MISEEIVKFLVCPVERRPLALADAELISRLNDRIGAQSLRNASGETITRRLDSGLIRDDHQVLYPIIDGIPILLASEAIHLEDLTDAN